MLADAPLVGLRGGQQPPPPALAPSRLRVNVPSLLEGRSAYARILHGRSDCAASGDAFVHTVRVADPDREIELSAEALPSPSYIIRSVSARALGGRVEPCAVDAVATLAGTAMVAGLGRRVREATGAGAGADLILDAVIEVARLARQVACLPRQRAERAAAAGPAGFWALDREGWIDLPDSCFTYSEAGRARLGLPDVAAAATPDLYSPLPSQPRVFERRRVFRLGRENGRLSLRASLRDNVHGFEVVFEVDLPSGRVVHADSTIARLPYAGICSEPQGKVRALLGEIVDSSLPKRLQQLVGGVTGCAQLFDLTADLIKLAAAPRV